MESVRTDFYLDGRWVRAAGGQSLEVHNPTTEEVIGTVPAGTAGDVDRAVTAARAAFEGWAATDPPTGPPTSTGCMPP